jgi:hypothetical protein
MANGDTENQSGGGPGSRLFSGLGTAVSDLGGYFGAQAKSSFDIAEAGQYDLAAKLALQNEQYTKMSTDIQEAQANRELLMSTGRTSSEVAGAGFAASGSALDILRSSAAQGSLQKAVIGQQGLITEAGYKEQAQSYELMQQAANDAASAEKTAGIGSFIAGGIDIVGGALSMLPQAAPAPSVSDQAIY